MSGISLHADHPVDELPEYVRGRARDPDAIERHLADCEICRVEVEVLRALEEAGPEPISDVERRRLYRAFDGRRRSETAPPEGRNRPLQPSDVDLAAVRSGWMRTTWRAAAAIALLLTGAGVWQVVQRAPGASSWNPELALRGWDQDLAEMDVGPGVVRAAFGLAAVDEIPWEDLEGVDPYEFEAPWEDN